MSWAELHSRSERLAEAAHESARAGDNQRAAELFSEAARLEMDALHELSCAGTLFSPSATQDVRHLDGRPCASACCRDATCRQRPSDASERFDATSLNFTDYWQDVRRITICTFLRGHCCVPSGLGEFRVTEAFAPRLGCFQGSRCPCADDFPLRVGPQPPEYGSSICWHVGCRQRRTLRQNPS
jgi:hypothetical protein